MNPRQTADVVIVGAGLMGCSIAYELAKRNGKWIVVLEKKYIGSEATGQSSGVLRSHYSIPILSWMAWESLETFQHAEEILGTSVGYKKVGYLLGVGPENAATLKENVKVMQSIGVDTELISPEQVIEMWPQMQVEKFGGFAFEPQGGYADPYLTAQAYASAARDMGVAIKQQCGVTKLITSEDGSAIVGVETTKNETIYSPCVIVAAGVGSRPVMSTVGIDVPVEGQRAQKLFIDPGEPLGEVPVFGDLVHLQYIRPEGSGHLLLGSADHSDPEYVDINNYPKHADEDYIETAVAKFLHCFPRLDQSKLLSGFSGVYEATPDYNPIMSTTPIEGVYVCTGFSGHGFKLTPMVGKLMANLILQGQEKYRDFDLSIFRLSRFKENDLLTGGNWGNLYKTKTSKNSHV